MIDAKFVSCFARGKLAAVLCSLLVSLAGCWLPDEEEVVVYAALDREFSEPILNQFAEDSGVSVLASYDVESTKSVGLTSQIMLEKDRPRCDVFWNNEILHTLRLEEQGLLDVYRSPHADDYPTQFVSSKKHWHGFAARVRVLIVNTDKVAAEDFPDSIYDLTDPKWQGQVAIAKPLAGTTATHAACLFASLGEDEAREYFEQLKQNAKILSGNKQVAQAVARGEFAYGLTDTDDAYIEKKINGQPVEIIFPDQDEGQMGALFIPNTLAIIKGGPNPGQARKLVDVLLQAKTEERLAQADSAQFPLHAQATVTSPVAPETALKKMEIDFHDALDQWDTAMSVMTELFATAD